MSCFCWSYGTLPSSAVQCSAVLNIYRWRFTSLLRSLGKFWSRHACINPSCFFCHRYCSWWRIRSLNFQHGLYSTRKFVVQLNWFYDMHACLQQESSRSMEKKYQNAPRTWKYSSNKITEGVPTFNACINNLH